MLHLKKTIVLRSIVIICHCLPVLFFAQSVNAAGLYRVDPYLQNPSETAVTVLCVSMVSVTATVEYFESNGTPIDVLTAETVPIPQTDSFYRVEARITGLEAGTKYSYRVALENNSGETDTSETAVFTTLDAAQDEIHFGVMNDLHDDTLVNETLGGYLQDYGAEFIFYNGDCWNDPWQDNNAKRPLDYLSSYVRKTNHASIPLLYIQGNHEWRAGFAKDMVYLFEADLLDYDDSMYEQQYQHAFTHANIRFIYMDCGEDGDKREDQFRPSRQRQTTWLQQEIAKPEFINARYRILLMHIPIWGSSGHVFADFWRETISDSDPKFSLMLCAHTHNTNLLEANSDHPFPVLINGKGSFIQVEADRIKLTAEVRNSNNNVVGSITVYPDQTDLIPDLTVAPNPAGTPFLFNIPLTGNFTVELFNSRGVKIKTYGNQWLDSEKISILSDIQKEANGIYYCKVRTNNTFKVKKIIVSK